MMDCKSFSTLIDPNTELGLCEENSPTNKRYYQRLVGKMIYLNHLKPDITFMLGLFN